MVYVISIFLTIISMSLATLKAKSLTMYGKTHSTNQGFSLNGPLRQPPIGANLGRSVTRTPFRGPAPMGHGMGSRCRVGGWRARTCGGAYPLIIHRSCLGTAQTKVKRSTMNQKGLIETSYTGILHGTYPHTHVYKVDKEEGGYTKSLGRDVLSCPVTEEVYYQSNSNCKPYTKTILDMNYERYYGIQTSKCVQMVELPQKIFHASSIGV
jgi:hypothetical protein